MPGGHFEKSHVIWIRGVISLVSMDKYFSIVLRYFPDKEKLCIMTCRKKLIKSSTNQCSLKSKKHYFL